MFFALLFTTALAAPGDIVDTFTAPGCYPSGLAWDGSHLWVSNMDSAGCDDPARDGNRVQRIDPVTRAVDVDFTTGTTIHHGLAFDGQVWAQTGWEDLTSYDPATTDLVDSWTDIWETLQLPHGMAYSPVDDRLYVAAAQDPSLYLVDPATGMMTDERFVLPFDLGNGDLAHDGCAVWMANSAEDVLVRFDALTGAVLETLDAPGPQASGLAWDGAYLWVSDSTTEQIYKVDAGMVDLDADGVSDCDNCLSVANTDQADCDNDGVGDACDTSCTCCPDYVPPVVPGDADEDGVIDENDLCAGFDDALDADGDSVPDGCDVCPGGHDLRDFDLDGIPDDCDPCASGECDPIAPVGPEDTLPPREEALLVQRGCNVSPVEGVPAAMLFVAALLFMRRARSLDRAVRV